MTSHSGLTHYPRARHSSYSRQKVPTSVRAREPSTVKERIRYRIQSRSLACMGHGRLIYMLTGELRSGLKFVHALGIPTCQKKNAAVSHARRNIGCISVIPADFFRPLFLMSSILISGKGIHHARLMNMKMSGKVRSVGPMLLTLPDIFIFIRRAWWIPFPLIRIDDIKKRGLKKSAGITDIHPMFRRAWLTAAFFF